MRVADDDWRTLRRTAIVLGMLALAWLLVRLNAVVLMMFAAVLLAVMYASLGALLQRVVKLPRTVAVGAAFVVVIAALGSFFGLFGQQLIKQLQAIAELVPEMTERLSQRFGVDVGNLQLDWSQLTGLLDASGMGRVLGYGASAAGIIANLLLVIFGGMFLAINPAQYVRGLSMLFPRQQQPLFHQAMGETARALRYWLGGQVVLMVAVGLASWAAYAWIGLPSAASLALLAGIANFIPFIGPFLGAIPAVLVAASIDMHTMWWTLAAAVIIQQAESYGLAPYVQKKAVSLPPFVGLFSIVVFGTLFGLVGVMLAVPMAVSALVLVQRLWVNEALGHDVEVVGEANGQDS